MPGGCLRHCTARPRRLRYPVNGLLSGLVKSNNMLKLPSLTLLLLTIVVGPIATGGGSRPPRDPKARAVTTDLPAFDRAEIFTLRLSGGFTALEKEPGPDRFPIRPYDAFSKIISEAELGPADSQQLRQLWRRLPFDALAGAMCHLPVYGLRCYDGDKLIFETTICWKCQNFYTPDDSKNGFGWFGFRSGPASATLLTFLRRHLPHPEL